MKDKLSFVDYMRIRQALDKTGEAPNAVITGHDKDPITYDDLYTALTLLSKDFKHYSDVYNSMSIDAIGFIVNKLISKKMMNSKDMLELRKQIQEEWSTENNDKVK